MRELSLHILDALENSLEAGATLVELTIEENLKADRLTITLEDNGRGMSAAQLARVFDPFYTTRTTRHVGLGLPLFKAAAERCNGNLVIDSQPGKGTMLQATFQHSHIDRAPLGDIQGTLLAVILGHRACDIRYIHRVIEKRQAGERAERRATADTPPPAGGGEETREFEFDTASLKAELEDVPLSHPSVRKWLREFITEGERDLR